MTVDAAKMREHADMIRAYVDAEFIPELGDYVVANHEDISVALHAYTSGPAWQPSEDVIDAVARAIRQASCETSTYPFTVWREGEAEANIMEWCRSAARAVLATLSQEETSRG